MSCFDNHVCDPGGVEFRGLDLCTVLSLYALVRVPLSDILDSEGTESRQIQPRRRNKRPELL